MRKHLTRGLLIAAIVLGGGIAAAGTASASPNAADPTRTQFGIGIRMDGQPWDIQVVPQGSNQGSTQGSTQGSNQDPNQEPNQDVTSRYYYYATYGSQQECEYYGHQGVYNGHWKGYQCYHRGGGWELWVRY